ncbi:DUF2062 domain-containing protein [Desulfonatronum sp. SC1]|uniref:DUF2062 domain-containing protein n=1 Tax=Desulfonatronum sp. SC1 TaxID=2109626 RepID=UPI000D2FBA96|nr:DUF2062 domain-containing protein [Desulfonatronum sp. SC1]PTN38050.1 hypothetical protein C6366_04080 [Desulfonatronum sp. SC1]
MQPRRTRLWWENLIRGLRHGYMRILRLKSSPQDIALGMGLGVFIGLLPIIPLQTVVVLALALLLRCSKLTALIGTLITNPLTIPFFYLIMLRIGRFFLPDGRGRLNPDHWTIGELLQAGWHFYGSILLGGFVIAVPSAVLAYFLTLAVTRAHQARRARKMATSPYKKHLYSSSTQPSSRPPDSSGSGA